MTKEILKNTIDPLPEILGTKDVLKAEEVTKEEVFLGTLGTVIFKKMIIFQHPLKLVHTKMEVDGDLTNQNTF